MNSKDFKNIMKNAFIVDYEGEDSELRCFKCGESTELKKIKKNDKTKWKVVCVNNHKYNLMEFLVKHIHMRDAVAKEFIENNESFTK